jgi:hypothetical protein
MQTMTDLRAMQAESDADNVRLIGYHDLNGHGDGMQLLKVGQYAYVAHLGTSKMALSILDCADPSSPRLVRQIPHPTNTHRHKVQIVGNILIQNNEVPYFMVRDADPSANSVPPVTGISLFDLDDPTDPEEIGFYPVVGKGVHRLWYSEPPYAHVAAWLPDVEERAYQVVDLSDPRRPSMAGCWWIPGTRAGDAEPWEKLDERQHFQVHGIIPHGDRAYVSCVDAGLAILDISDVANPRLISRLNWHPPYGGYIHTALPLPSRGLLVVACESTKPTCEEDGDKRIWMVDIREERQPVSISSFPRPVPPKGSPWSDYCERPLRFGPHNVHENRPGSFHSETLIFATYYNAGLRIVDIGDQFRPTEVGHFVPPPPAGQEAPQINDVFVDADGLIYLTDRIKGGMYIVEYTGAGTPRNV